GPAGPVVLLDVDREGVRLADPVGVVAGDADAEIDEGLGRVAAVQALAVGLDGDGDPGTRSHGDARRRVDADAARRLRADDHRALAGAVGRPGGARATGDGADATGDLRRRNGDATRGHEAGPVTGVLLDGHGERVRMVDPVRGVGGDGDLGVDPGLEGVLV